VPAIAALTIHWSAWMRTSRCSRASFRLLFGSVVRYATSSLHQRAKELWNHRTGCDNLGEIESDPFFSCRKSASYFISGPPRFLPSPFPWTNLGKLLSSSFRSGNSARVWPSCPARRLAQPFQNAACRALLSLALNTEECRTLLSFAAFLSQPAAASASEHLDSTQYIVCNCRRH